MLKKDAQKKLLEFFENFIGSDEAFAPITINACPTDIDETTEL